MRSLHSRRIIPALLSAILAFVIAVPGAFAQTGSVNPGVFSPGSNPFGVSYGEWSARWWQWALSFQPQINPLLDQTGKDCARGQSGPAWFLAGNFGGTTTRSCAIPTDKGVLYPVANAFCTPPDANTEDGLRKCAAALMNRAGELRSEVDGISIQSLNTYRVQSPLFRFTLPQNNIFGADPGCYLLTQPCSPSLTFDAVSDGYWIMLAPLPAGQHTVHFSAKLPSLSFAVDVTYNLTVG